MHAFRSLASLAASNVPPEDRMGMLQEGLVAGAVIAVAIVLVALLLGAVSRRKEAVPGPTGTVPAAGTPEAEAVGAEDAERDAQVELELKNRFLDRRITRGTDVGDGILEAFTSVARTLESNRVRIYTDPHGFERELKECVQKLDAAVRDLRACVVGQSSKVIRTAAFIEALERDLAGLRAEFKAQFDVKVDEDAVARLSPDQLDRLRGIAVEAASNALRHGRSRIVSLSLRRGEQASQLVVQDNGRGFAPDLLVSEGRGFPLMRSLAAEAGGRLEVVSRIGNGARVVASIPSGGPRAAPRVSSAGGPAA